MHKAKGLEWDRVYLMSANNYDYPSGDPFDTFIGEKWFIRDQLESGCRSPGAAQIAGERRATTSKGLATRDARIDYAAERLRLLYVGITRARLNSSSPGTLAVAANRSKPDPSPPCAAGGKLRGITHEPARRFHLQPEQSCRIMSTVPAAFSYDTCSPSAGLLPKSMTCSNSSAAWSRANIFTTSSTSISSAFRRNC